MHKATCDSCGNTCEVPFKPTGGKPIYCDQCFEAKKGDRSEGSKQVNEQLKVMDAKIDKILEAVMPAASKKAEPKKEEAKQEKKPTAKKTAAKKSKAKKTTKKVVAKKKK